jgi:excisionase family DNA binding protein
MPDEPQNDKLVEAVARTVREELARERNDAKKLAYTVEETAQALGLEKTSVYRLLTRRKLKSVPGLRKKIIPASEIQKFLATAR